MIEIRNVWKRYDHKVILENLNFQANAGEFITIVGASGCGKTTFLRMLLGEISPSQGEISINDQPLALEPTSERGVLFQRYSVFPHLTAVENVMLGLEFKSSRLSGRSFGKKRKEQRKVAAAMLERVGLSHVLTQYPSELSGGMQQRLALAQTLIAEPGVLLLDEPFGALDPGIRADMHELVTDLHRELDLTIFMITHDLQEGFSLGSRLLVFDKVRVDPHDPDLYGASITFDLPVGQSGDPDSIYEQLKLKPEQRGMAHA